MALAPLFSSSLPALPVGVHISGLHLPIAPDRGSTPPEQTTQRPAPRHVFPIGELVSPHLRHPRTTSPCIQPDTVYDPFAGTGTFITRLLHSGVIKPEDLSRKFHREIFANEIVLLSYYIAAVNIEAMYRELCEEAGLDAGDTGFPGISLTDTFAMDERQNHLGGGVFAENTARVEQQRTAAISVILMNPPYSVGQKSANDNNQNAKYPLVDGRIADTYAKRSTATLKNGLYDSYYRALRWATDRIGERGVIGSISNSAFIDGNTADGVRLTWQDEFDEIFVFDLRGAIRGKQGDAAKKEGQNVFDIMTGVAITFLVKTGEGGDGPAKIHYCDIGDYLTREEKFEILERDVSVAGTEFTEITPNEAGDWINQRDQRFGTYQAIASKDPHEQAVFGLSSNGLKTNRDAWCYNFDEDELRRNIHAHVDYLNAERERVYRAISNGADKSAEQLIRRDSTRVSWDRINISDVKRNRPTELYQEGFRLGIYRPFLKQSVYFDPSQRLNNCTYQLPKLWPTASHDNLAIGSQRETRRDYSVFITTLPPDLESVSKAQWFPRYTWEPLESADGAFNLDALAAFENDVIVDGYRRLDNITDETLAGYRRVYVDDSISKDDIFYYVYALLHHPEYRECYAADLKKMLPRIPHCAGFADYARIGRALADLHIHYENLPAHEALQYDFTADAPDDAYERYRIGNKKMSWTKRTAKTALKYNEYLTISGIPAEANDYQIGGRSPLEWIIDRYYIKTDKASGIVNDPNDWLREQHNPRYVADLMGSLVTLSLETQRLVSELPTFEVLDNVGGPHTMS